MAPSAPDLTGRVIGEYEIQGLLGVGGMGAVYEGRHPVIGKRVAVKVLLPQLSEARPVVERFIDEARAVNAIGHRGIVDIFSFGKLPEGSVYFVMEYLDGKPLDRLIRGQPLMPIHEALETIAEVCDGLAAAHSAGIIHRDIKPSNIFVVKNARGQSYVKLLDFGIAKLNARTDEASPQTLEGQALGTPDYMSPEQARGLPISYAADLYSTGCVLFELLTGKRVFKGPNVQRTMFMHAEDPPPVPSSLRPEIPADLDNLVLWMLEKKPEDRPKSALEVRAHCLALKEKLQPAITPAPNQALVTPIPPRRSAPTPLPPDALAKGEPPPTAHQRPVRPAPSAAERAAHAATDYADLEAGRVVILSRPPDPPQSAPTNQVPKLEPVLSPRPPGMPPPPPWEGTDRMLNPSMQSEADLPPVARPPAPPQIAPARPSTPPPAAAPRRTASQVGRPPTPAPGKATPAPKPEEPIRAVPDELAASGDSPARLHAASAAELEKTASGFEPRTEAALPNPLRRERRLKRIGAGAAGLCALAGLVWFVSRPAPQPPTHDRLPATPPVNEPVPVHVEPAAERHQVTPPEPVAPAEPPKPVEDPKHEVKNVRPAHPPPPKPAGPSLADRLARCEALLAKREAAKGADPVLRGFVAQVRAEVANADTDAKRREAGQHLSELQQQLSE